MKILALSDTHGSLYDAKNAINANPDVDLIIHLGDYLRDAKRLSVTYPEKKFEYIPGNCDFVFDKGSMEKILEFEGKRILLTHGHRYAVKTGLERICSLAQEHDIDLLLFGHTHEANLVSKPGFILLNPGSVSLPRGSAKKSYALIEISEEEIKAKILYL